MACHNLWEYGSPDVMPWQGAHWLLSVKRAYLAVAHRLWPTRTIEMHKAVPWDDLFGPKGRWPFRELFEHDPLRNEGYQYRLAYSMLRRRSLPVPFEDCRTPIQLIASEKNKLWSYDLNLRAYQRLGGEKELVTLEGKPHWEWTREFDETFCSHALGWYRRHGGATSWPGCPDDSPVDSHRIPVHDASGRREQPILTVHSAPSIFGRDYLN